MTAVPYDTLWPADTVEFCPHPAAQDIFVCGTYQLDEASSAQAVAEKRPQTRFGKLLVFRLISNATEYAQFEKIHEIGNIPAILDLSWCPRPTSHPPLLAAADSEGNVRLFHWDLESATLIAERVVRAFKGREGQDSLCLSLDWGHQRFQSPSPSLITSLSFGSLSLITDEASARSIQWHAHDYEPWTAAFDFWDPNVVYSGGDDVKLKMWDTRFVTGEANTIELEPSWTNKRFDAGVTSIQSNPHIEHLIAVGTYDSKVRLFDTRYPQRAIQNSEVEVGGGAWRVKWHPDAKRKHDALVACMYDGFKIVHFGEGPAEVVQRFDDHTSIAYGADWCRKVIENAADTVLATCSFYDHSLRVRLG